jgi:predicted lipid-binding transport protein (Tim44 family)
MRAYIGRRGPGVSFGCLGTLVIGLMYLVVFAVIGAIIGAVVASFVVAIVLALVVLAVDRVLLALSPSRRARGAAQKEFRPDKAVIEATARAISSTKQKGRR